MSDEPDLAVSKQAVHAQEKLKDSAETLVDSAAKQETSVRRQEKSTLRQEDSAETRTRLASDRTLLAAERTYAAWMRTGLASLAAGIGSKALLQDLVRPVLVLATSLVLIVFAEFCFVCGVWRELTGHSQPPRPDTPRPAGLAAGTVQRLSRGAWPGRTGRHTDALIGGRAITRGGAITAPAGAPSRS